MVTVRLVIMEALYSDNRRVFMGEPEEIKRSRVIIERDAYRHLLKKAKKPKLLDRKMKDVSGGL